MSVAATGAQAVYDRRDIKQTLNDNYITMQANQKIYADKNRFKDTHISITTFNNEVLLTGEIPDASKRQEVEHIVKNIEGVNLVHNKTITSPPSSSLIRVSDSWITTKIKTQLITSNDVSPSDFKVVTENGTVYLMGTVRRDEADAAVEIASNTAGVQEVVKLFYYINISRE